MIKRYSIGLLLWGILLSISAPAQPISRYNTFSYNVNEGLLQSTLIDMAFDKNNFCWISYPNGIQRFDGKNFVTVPVQPGLPKDEWVRFFRTSAGELLISHTSGFSKYEAESNRFVMLYKKEEPIERPAVFIGEDEHSIYMYNGEGVITGFDAGTFKMNSQTTTGLPGYASDEDLLLKFSDNIINHKVAIHVSGRLILWDLQKRKLLFESPRMPNISNYLLFLKSEKEVFYQEFRGKSKLFIYNFQNNTSTVSESQLNEERTTPFRSLVFPWNDKIIISADNHIYEADTNLLTLKNELVNFQNAPVSGFASPGRFRTDNFGNLYINTVTSGIKKMIRKNYPIKYYGNPDKDKSFILSVLPDKKNNRILAGTSGNGLLVFDTSQHLIKHITSLPGEKNMISVNSIIKGRNEDYICFSSGKVTAWRLSKDLSEIQPLAISSTLSSSETGISYYSLVLKNNDKEAIIHSQNNIYRVNFTAYKVEESKPYSNSPISSLLYNNQIIIHTNNNLLFFDANTLTEQTRIPFPNTGQVRCFATGNSQNIYIGCNKGIYTIDQTGRVLNHLDKKSGLPDECIYAITVDREGSLWCSSNKGIFRISKDNAILQLTKDDGLQENEFNTNVVAEAEDGEIFFGGVNGVSSFFPSAISSVNDKPVILLTDLKVNNQDYFRDTAVWMLNKMVLPYQKNTFSFDFVAMGSGSPEQYLYQYKMEGIDKEWIQSSSMQTVRYFLQPGSYVFQLYASRQFDPDAKPLKEIIIIIKPPFWKTWWFLAGICLLTLSLLSISINQRNKRKYASKLQLLENEKQIQQERERISKDLHDSLGAYANAVLYNAELLERADTDTDKQKLLSDLRFASKDIITSLRETVWALKKEEYTADECLVRIRNFMQPLVRYYTYISFAIDGETPAGLSLHYTKALAMVRIVQEAAANAIKHASPSRIIIDSSVTAASKWSITITDNGKGFDYAAAKNRDEGSGLYNMEHRAAAAAIDYRLESNPGRGTKITLII